MRHFSCLMGFYKTAIYHFYVGFHRVYHALPANELISDRSVILFDIVVGIKLTNLRGRQ